MLKQLAIAATILAATLTGANALSDQEREDGMLTLGKVNGMYNQCMDWKAKGDPIEVTGWYKIYALAGNNDVFQYGTEYAEFMMTTVSDKQATCDEWHAKFDRWFDKQ